MKTGNSKSIDRKAKRMFALCLSCMLSKVKLSQLPLYKQTNAFSLKEIFAEVKEDSATEPRRFSVYITNHGDSIMCPLFWHNEEHCNLIISNLKSSQTRMPTPFAFFHSMAFQDTKRGTS